MKNFLQIGAGVDVMPLLLEIKRQDLWDKNQARLYPTSPHRETHDIWLRYNDEKKHKETGDYSTFNDPHDGVWYPAFYALPAARPIIFNLMARVEGERLGGVLIYNVPAGKKIYPHVDTGWHVDYFEKFNICLSSNPKARFCYAGETMFAKPGDVHWFINNIEHEVFNDGEDDHIVMTVCIRTHNYGARVK